MADREVSDTSTGMFPPGYYRIAKNVCYLYNTRQQTLEILHRSVARHAPAKLPQKPMGGVMYNRVR